MKRLLTLAFTSLAIASVSHAAIVYIVDFRDSGTTDITGANTVDPISSTQNQPVVFNDNISLTDTNGTGGLTLGNFNAVGSGGGSVITVEGRTFGGTDDVATRPEWATLSAAGSLPSILGPSGETITLSFTVSGFTPNVGVDVSMISSYMDNGGDLDSRITINGVNSDFFNGLANGAEEPYADLNWSNTELFADASGNLDFEMTTTDRRISLNAMQITPVPEPSTVALFFGLGALGVVLIRRRRRGLN